MGNCSGKFNLLPRSNDHFGPKTKTDGEAACPGTIENKRRCPVAPELDSNDVNIFHEKSPATPQCKLEVGSASKNTKICPISRSCSNQNKSEGIFEAKMDTCPAKSGVFCPMATRADGEQSSSDPQQSQGKPEIGPNDAGTAYASGCPVKNSCIDSKSKAKEQTLTDAIIEAAFDAMFLSDEKGIIQFVNETALVATGYSREELIGQNVSLIVGGDQAKKHDFYMKRYLKTGKSSIIGKTREGQGLLARRKDGTEFPAELGLAEIRTGSGDVRQYVGFARDISQRKKDEAELQKRMALAEAIIEASIDAMFVVDDKGEIEMVNSAATGLFSYTRNEFVGQNISMIDEKNHGEVGKVQDGFLQRHLRMNERVEIQARRKNGALFPAEIGFRAVRSPTLDAGLYCAYVHDLTEHKKILEMQIEQTKAEALLLNMLPEAIADRLKGDPTHIADHHACVAILFADIVGFTELSHKMSPVKLVGMLNELFSMFDDLVDKYDLNKVKTIGDCYMVTSRPDIAGVEKQRLECKEMCNFGMDMLASLRQFNRHNSEHNLSLRIGINTGPVVAGVVGTKRFLYDIWGDTVNVASRMESTGVAGRIQVTSEVVNTVGNEFLFDRRGMIHCKGKGELETFFLVRRKGERKVSSVIGRRRSNFISIESDETDIAMSEFSNLRGTLQTLRSERELLDTRIEQVQREVEREASHRSM